MKRFLALGDSYTIGEGVPESERWPTQLVSRLRALNIAVADPQIIARTAWTTDELSDAIAAETPRGPYDLVTLMIGVNDQYRDRPLNEFTRHLEPLMDTATALAGHPSRTIVISIPDWGYTPFAAGRDRALISSQIDAFNEVLARCSGARGAAWVDVTGISRTMSDGPGRFARDGLHPGGAVHARWAERVLDVARRALDVT